MEKQQNPNIDPNKQQTPTPEPKSDDMNQKTDSDNGVSTDKFNQLMSNFNNVKNTVHNLSVKLNNRNDHVSNAKAQKQAADKLSNASQKKAQQPNQYDQKLAAMSKKIDQLTSKDNVNTLKNYAANALKKNGLSSDANTVKNVMSNDSKGIDSKVNFLKSFKNKVSNVNPPKSTQRHQKTVNIGDALSKQNVNSKRSLDDYVIGNNNKGGNI